MSCHTPSARIVCPRCMVQDRLFRGTRMSIYNQSFYVTMVSALLSLSGEQ